MSSVKRTYHSDLIATKSISISNDQAIAVCKILGLDPDKTLHISVGMDSIGFPFVEYETFIKDISDFTEEEISLLVGD